MAKIYWISALAQALVYILDVQLSHLICTLILWRGLIVPFYRWGKRGTGQLSNSPREDVVELGWKLGGQCPKSGLLANKPFKKGERQTDKNKSGLEHVEFEVPVGDPADFVQ